MTAAGSSTSSRRRFLAVTGLAASQAILRPLCRATAPASPRASDGKTVPGLPSGAITLDEIIARRGRHRLPHEARLADPMHRSYSWGRHATEDTPEVEGARSVNAWIVVFRTAGEQATTPDVRVNVRRLALWACTGGTWIKGSDGLPSWTVSSNRDTSGDYQRIPPRLETDGSQSFEFPVHRALHFSAKAPGLQLQGCTAIVTLVEARLLGSGQADWLIGSGADFRDPAGSARSIRQSGFGHLGLLTSRWRSYPMLSSSLSDEAIRRFPPPL